MSQNSRKGYDGERPIELLMQGQGLNVHRPRAGQPHDVGDLAGLPYVISAKNQKTLRLAAWVSDAEAMAVNAGLHSAVVWHKKPGKSSPLDWYVTMSGRLFMPWHDLAIEHWEY